MARQHVEFVQSQALAWDDGFLGGLRPAVEQKTLSADEATGAASLLAHYPAGFQMEDPNGMTAAEEVLVLDGSIRFGDALLTRDAYGYFPAGTAHGTIGSTSGAVVLTFFDRSPESASDTNQSGSHVIVIDTVNMPWGPGIADSELKHMGLLRKVLRDDVDKQERTLLLSMSPQGYPPGMAGVQICHPCVEEMYLLSGDLISEYGVGHAGAYFWRPPQIPHGPHGSHGGAFMLIRFVEGSHRNDWTDNKIDFQLDPDYRPALPDGLPDIDRLEQAAVPPRNY
jgi:hypothetical protein